MQDPSLHVLLVLHLSPTNNREPPFILVPEKAIYSLSSFRQGLGHILHHKVKRRRKSRQCTSPLLIVMK
jgi:hypothetical protein